MSPKPISMKQRRLDELREDIPRISPAAAYEKMQSGAILLDVREPRSVEQGSPAEAVRLSRDFLELTIETELPDANQVLMILCESGVSSFFVADDLIRLGYSNVYSIDNGFNGWKAAGLPWNTPVEMDDDARVRYSRHLLIPEIGEQGQAALLKSKVLILGAGGLGSPAALYLAAAGVGTIGIVDNDVVDRSNLQRQILHDDAHVGAAKTESARYRLRGINPAINVIRHTQRLDKNNVDTILSNYELVIDGSDNLATRYCLNDACLRAGIPLVYGAIFRFHGQVSVFNYRQADGGLSACYRCLFEEAVNIQPPACSEVGVLGVLPGVIGTLQATEGLKLLLGIGEPLAGRLLSYDALASRFRETRLTPATDCSCRQYS